MDNYQWPVRITTHIRISGEDNKPNFQPLKRELLPFSMMKYLPLHACNQIQKYTIAGFYNANSVFST